MITVYITTPGTKIVKNGGVLKVVKEGTVFHTIFPFRTDQLVIFGGVEITSSAIHVLLKNGITTIFLNKNGHYNGRLVGPYDHNVMLRRLQYKTLDDEQRCLSFCRSVTVGKLRNQMVLLQRIKRFQKVNLSSNIERMKNLINEAQMADNIASLRGYEGAGAKEYFSVFNRGFVQSQGFRKRIRRPPTDPVNATLSLLYTILFNRVSDAVEKEGLDPYVGIFHSIGYSRMSLALDLMEEFRPVIVDTLVLSLFNMNIVGKDDFRIHRPDPQSIDEEILLQPENDTPDVLADRMGGFGDAFVDQVDISDGPQTSIDDDGHDIDAQRIPVLLTQDALRKVLKQFERKLETRFSHPIENRRMSYRDALSVQVRQYISFLREEVAEYQPLIMS